MTATARQERKQRKRRPGEIRRLLAGVDAVSGNLYLRDAAEGKEEFDEVFGRLVGSLFDDVGDGIGDGRLEGDATGVESCEVYANELARLEHVFGGLRVRKCSRCEWENARTGDSEEGSRSREQGTGAGSRKTNQRQIPSLRGLRSGDGPGGNKSKGKNAGLGRPPLQGPTWEEPG
jgi:hypothetical protein